MATPESKWSVEPGSPNSRGLFSEVQKPLSPGPAGPGRKLQPMLEPAVPVFAPKDGFESLPRMSSS